MAGVWQRDLRELKTESVPACILCPGTIGEPDLRWNDYLALPDPYGVVRCPDCGLRWLNPRPSAEGCQKLYSQETYFGGKGASPADYEKVIADRLSYLSQRIRKASRMLGDRDNPLSVLDYGAATGDFVSLARSEGHRCEGVELSADARAAAHARHGLRLMSPEQARQLAGAQFDVIHMNHVLEHMPNPLEHLQWCCELLRPYGLLIIEVPQQFDNDLDRVRRWLGRGGKQKRFDAYSLHHTYFFSPQTMSDLLARAGFRNLQVSTFNPGKAPLWPPKVSHWILRIGLGLADRIHRGGNIIEVFATKI